MVYSHITPIAETSASNSPVKSKAEPTFTHENSIAAGRLTQAEKVEKGSIPWITYHIYIKAAGGYIVAILVLFTFVFNIFSTGIEEKLNKSLFFLPVYHNFIDL